MLDESARRIAEAHVATLDDVRAAPALIGFTPAMREENLALKSFLLEQLYRHPRVVAMTDQARRIVRELFDAFLTDVSLLPSQYRPLAERAPARTVADYIAGMTDRYAAKEHRRLFGGGARLGLPEEQAFPEHDAQQAY